MAQSIDWPMFRDPKVIASFSVWQSPETLEAFVYKTVHGAFFKRRDAWFVPDAARGHVLWWVPRGTVPEITEARARVERLATDGPGDAAFDLTFARDQGWL